MERKDEKSHFERDIHDYVTWATKPTQMMRREYESHNSSYTVVAHSTGTMHLKVDLFQCETCIMGIV